MVIGPWAIGGIWLGYGQVGRGSKVLPEMQKIEENRKDSTENFPGTFSNSIGLGYRAGIVCKLETQVLAVVNKDKIQEVEI